MDDLLKDFLTETKSGLEEIDNDLVNLEKNPEDADAIKSIFRILHTIKGTCGFIGLPKLEKIAHKGEDVLNKIRDGELTATTDIVSLIFDSIDAIRTVSEYLENNDGIEPDTDYSELYQRLEAAVSGNTAQPKTTKEEPPSHEQSVSAESPLNLIKEVEESKAENDNREASSKEKLAEPSKKPEEKKATNTKTAANTNDSIRVKIQLLDQLMQSVSELVLTRNQLLQLSQRDNQNNSLHIANSFQKLSLITTELQEGIMKTRMQPLSNILNSFPRMIRDISKDLNKKIELKISGEDTELDRHLLEQIKDPFTHMLRNSADHGVETPNARKEKGKPEIGTIHINAFHASGCVVIQIIDDGAGIPVEKLRNKIIEKGILSTADAEKLTDDQVRMHIFHAGFSTAEKLTAVSGRGVGMDVVRTNIEKIGGSIELESKENIGTTFTIRIPLTLAIMPILTLMLAGQKYAIPLINISEIIRVGTDSQYKIEFLNNSPILRIRDLVIPLIDLKETLKLSKEKIDPLAKKFIVVCQLANNFFGIISDKIKDIEEIVVKPVSGALKTIQEYSGITILGDCSVIMILDCAGISKHIKNSQLAAVHDAEGVVEKFNREQRTVSSLLLFRAKRGDSIKAMPLEVVTRLEEIDLSQLEETSGKLVLQYRDTIMSIVSFDENEPIPREGLSDVIVLSDGNRTVGLVINSIIDIVGYKFSNKLIELEDPRYISAAVINEKTTEIVDAAYFMRKAHEETLKAPIKAPRTSNQDAPHIMLVDDSSFFRKFIPPAINDAGYKVTAVESVEKAMELLSTDNFSLVITDINMPGKDGIELMNYCKSNDNLKNIPIIGLSSLSLDEAKNKLGSGQAFDAYIQKTQHSKLLETISELVA